MKRLVFNNPVLAYFSKWSRSKFGILRSLRTIIRICTLSIVYTIIKSDLPVYAQADTTVIAPIREVDEVEVAGTRNVILPRTAGLTVSVPAAAFDHFPSVSFQDVLEFAGNIDIRQRGRNGVQSDASIRGGSFDHVLVLLNGVNMTDPQTGHASMDLPVDKDIVGRIEVSYGPSAMVYGPGAFTGAINIITRLPQESSVTVSQEIGDFGLLKSGMYLLYSGDKIKSIFSAGRQSSSGYAPNTDFTNYNIYFNSSIQEKGTNIMLQGGIQKKKFGASGFYTPLFPDQYEKTGLSFGSLKIETGKNLKVSPAVYWRQRHDYFMLDRKTPSFYRNFHRSDVYGGQVNLKYSLDRITFASIMDFRSENILSNSLGFELKDPVSIRGEDSIKYDRKYSRQIYSFSGQVIYMYGRLGVTGGAILLGGSTYREPKLLPAIGLEYLMKRNLSAFVNYNTSGSLPSFTDLFYKDPNNEGSSDLAASSLSSLEAGLKYSGDRLTGSAVIFSARGNNIIEWLWSDSLSRYKPYNTNNLTTAGFEATTGLRVMLTGKREQSIKVNYMYLSVRKPYGDVTSKYNNLKHKLSVMITNSLPWNFSLSWNVSYQERLGSFVTWREGAYHKNPYAPVWLADLNLEWHYRYATIYAGATNVFGKRYSDTGSLYQPGRWFSGGISMQLPLK